MATVWGVPFAMLISTAVFFVTLPSSDPHFWTPLGVLLGAAIAAALGASSARPKEHPHFGNAIACLSLPALRHLSGGANWSGALIGGGTVVLVIGILLILVGAVLLRKARNSAGQIAAVRMRGPAEWP